MKMTLLIEVKVPGQHSVALHQTGKNQFAVRYGEQWNVDLSRTAAASALGNCIFHALSCNGEVREREVYGE